jgi:hypothetical protein
MSCIPLFLKICVFFFHVTDGTCLIVLLFTSNIPVYCGKTEEHEERRKTGENIQVLHRNKCVWRKFNKPSDSVAKNIRTYFYIILTVKRKNPSDQQHQHRSCLLF